MIPASRVFEPQPNASSIGRRTDFVNSKQMQPICTIQKPPVSVPVPPQNLDSLVPRDVRKTSLNCKPISRMQPNFGAPKRSVATLARDNRSKFDKGVNYLPKAELENAIYK